MVYTEEPNVKDHIQRCPAFSDGCPFQNKSAKECEELVQSIPKDHPKCPVFDQDAKFCPDGTNLMHMLDSQRHDLFTHKKH
ncbi:hypothetical protein BZG36_03545 [Bifiguratus adelaidae]|uniref:Uncharacterized protein n=1 Tax=Bifiguratus adelaidae TaxID=1938954 RepID=A0A261XZB1_9FUNG|nr:hypothetical protein BZG36_03545 [Bifiguratus adelaidae]